MVSRRGEREKAPPGGPPLSLHKTQTARQTPLPTLARPEALGVAAPHLYQGTTFEPPPEGPSAGAGSRMGGRRVSPHLLPSACHLASPGCYSPCSKAGARGPGHRKLQATCREDTALGLRPGPLVFWVLHSG